MSKTLALCKPSCKPCEVTRHSLSSSPTSDASLSKTLALFKSSCKPAINSDLSAIASFSSAVAASCCYTVVCRPVIHVVLCSSRALKCRFWHRTVSSAARSSVSKFGYGVGCGRDSAAAAAADISPNACVRALCMPATVWVLPVPLPSVERLPTTAATSATVVSLSSGPADAEPPKTVGVPTAGS